MSFIGDMFSSGKGAGFQAQAPDPAQIGTAYNQTQQGLFHQEQFVNALQAQNGLGNQGNVFNQQQGLANQLQGVANGTGPNPAQAQLNQATGQNVANQSALMAGQRGSGANAGLMARLAAHQGANLQQQAVGQGATLQAQQQLAAMQQLQNQQANMGNLANTQVSQQQTGLNAYNTAALQQQQNLLGLQANANSANAAIAGGNQGAQQGLFGGLMGGVGSGLMGMLGGGSSGGAATGGGEAMAGGAGDAVGEGATMVAAHGGMVPQKYADGGGVAADPLMQPMEKSMVIDREAPESNVGRMLSSGIDPNGGMKTAPKASGGGMGAGMGNAVSQLGGTAMKGLFSWGEHEALPYIGEFFGGLGTTAGGLGGAMAGGAGDVGGAMAADSPEIAAGAAEVAPEVAAAAHGGGIGVHGELLAAQGRQVPGQAAVKGDSYKNDTVPARLSPGEIVIPRHIALGPNAPAEAAKFVANVLSKNQNMACGGGVKAYADGGEVRPEIPVQFPERRPDVNKAREAMRGADEGQTMAKGWQNLKEEFGYGDKPQVKGYADGGGVMSDVGEMIGKYGINPLMHAVSSLGQGAIDTAKGMGNTAGELTQGLQKGTGMYLPGSSVNPQAEAPPPPMAPQASQASNYNLGQAPQAPAAPPQDMFKGYDPTAGYKTQMQGLQQEFGKPGDAEPGGIQGQMAKAQATNAAEQQQVLQGVNATIQANALEHDREIRSTIKDIQQNKIDPNAYINNMGTGQKVGTAIGLILGGMGGGLTHQENPAMKFLMSNIDRDVEAQKANLNQKNNVLSAYERLYGDKQTATLMTKALLTAQTEEKLKEAMAQNGGPLAQSRGQQALGPLQNAYNQAIYEAGMRKTMMQGMQSGNPEGTLQAMRYLNPPMAKEMESRYVPGVGMASIPVPEGARKEMTLRTELDQKLQKLEAFTQKHSGTVMDRNVVNTGKSLAQDVQDVYRRANGQGVFKESESNFVKGMVNTDPTAFFSQYRNLPGYKATQDSNKTALKLLYKAHGLNPSMPQFNPR